MKNPLHNAGLSTRILLFFLTIMSVLFFALLGTQLYMFKEDKLAYIYDLHDFQLEKVSENIREAINAREKTSAIASSVENSFDVGMPRLPEKGEIFFGFETNNTPLIFFRNEKDELLSQKLSSDWQQRFFNLQSEALKTHGTRVYWLSVFGRVLGSTLPLSGSEEVANRPLVKNFLASPLPQAVTQIVDAKEKIVGGFREVPGTNTVIFIETPFAEVFRSIKNFILASIVVAAGIGAITLILSVYFFDRMWKPILDIARLTSRIATGDYNVSYQYPYHDEVAFVFERVVQMAGALKTREVELAQSQRKLGILERDLETANLIQQNLLPNEKELKLPPQVEFSAWYKPCEKVGGDWYGVHYNESEKTIYAFIGDVTGHGTGSALLSGVTAGCALGTAIVAGINAQKMGVYPLSHEEQLLSIRDSLDLVIKEMGRGEYLLTLCILTIQVETGEMCYLSAGHPAPFLFIQSGPLCKPLVETSDVLGSPNPQNRQWKTGNHKLKTGDVLFSYTDGLKENKGPDGSLFSSRDIRKALSVATSKNASAQETRDIILEAANKVWQNEPPLDDVSYFVLKWNA